MRAFREREEEEWYWELDVCLLKACRHIMQYCTATNNNDSIDPWSGSRLVPRIVYAWTGSIAVEAWLLSCSNSSMFSTHYTRHLLSINPLSLSLLSSFNRVFVLCTASPSSSSSSHASDSHVFLLLFLLHVWWDSDLTHLLPIRANIITLNSLHDGDGGGPYFYSKIRNRILT